MAAKYILQSRETDGVWSSPYGSGIKFKVWKTRFKFENEKEALNEFYNRKGKGLVQWRIRYNNKSVTMKNTWVRICNEYT